MGTSTSVFYGDVATTWSLVRAAEAHKLIHLQLCTLELIIKRKQKGLLQASTSSLSHASCPVELLWLVKEELYTVGIEAITRCWQVDYLTFLRNVRKGGDMYWTVLVSDSKAAAFAREDASPKYLQTTWDWLRWTKDLAMESELGDWNNIRDTWGVRSLLTRTTINQAQRLLYRLDLEAVSIHDYQANYRGQSYWWLNPVTDLVTPIASQLALHEQTGVSEPVQFMDASQVIKSAVSPHSPLIYRQFSKLFHHYHVEFVFSTQTSKLLHAPLAPTEKYLARWEKAEVEPHSMAPKPRWMLWSQEVI